MTTLIVVVFFCILGVSGTFQVSFGRSCFAIWVFFTLQIPFQDQMDVFSAPPADRAHVILATNMAESSLTIPSVRVVIDYGQKKQLSYDTKRRVNVLRLNWCSKASLDQRKGQSHY